MLYTGGHTAGKGTYWDAASGERIEMAQEQTLPGDRTRIYVKAPAAVMLMAGPILGLIFAVFLPFIGILMTVGQAAKKLSEVVGKATSASMSFGWRPVEAYLTGRRKKKEAREKKPPEKK